MDRLGAYRLPAEEVEDGVLALAEDQGHGMIEVDREDCGFGAEVLPVPPLQHLVPQVFPHGLERPQRKQNIEGRLGGPRLPRPAERPRCPGPLAGPLQRLPGEPLPFAEEAGLEADRRGRLVFQRADEILRPEPGAGRGHEERARRRPDGQVDPRGTGFARRAPVAEPGAQDEAAILEHLHDPEMVGHGGNESAEKRARYTAGEGDGDRLLDARSSRSRTTRGLGWRARGRLTLSAPRPTCYPPKEVRCPVPSPCSPRRSCSPAVTTPTRRTKTSPPIRPPSHPTPPDTTRWRRSPRAKRSSRGTSARSRRR